ncbi:MAG: hypothetical protein Q8K70_07620 [Bacteroidota bacterium]|nr:hypothetical protein [Bacteroidota bacterium]
MKQAIFTLLFSISFFNVDAKSTDSTRRVDVGDSVFISNCLNNTYKHIQFYRKTRFPNPQATYNKTTGDDFYEYFFLDGDFDVKTLPCEYGNQKYRIISIRVFADKKTGQDRPVMFLDLGLNTVAWVELNGAVESLEIYLQ